MPTQTQQVETILKLNVDYEKGIKDVGAYLAEIKKLKDEQKALDKAFKAGAISEQQYGDALAKNKTVTTQLNGEMKVLTTELKKKLEADRAEKKQIDINTASYNELSKTYTQMKKRINEMDAAERQRNKSYIDQSKAVYERMKSLQEETGKMQLNVGNYQAAITQAITGNSRFASSLMGIAGGASSASGALGIVSKDAMAASQAMMTLLANPVFLAIAGVAGIGMAYHWWKDYNDGLAEATRLTQQFTGQVGPELDGIRDSIQATADAFGKDFKETLQAADTLVAQYGISWQDAVNTINKGFEAGADINGDFLSQVKQFAPALRDAGLSAEELVTVIQQTRSGVFGTDGIQVITKASKALRDMSTSTADALRGIGINADELKTKLADGSITMMQAIQQVSEHLKGVGANTQEAGAIISDVFGRKGVAAGQEQIKAFADLEMSLDSLIEKEGEYGKVQQQIVETQTLINKYTSALFGMDGWDVMKKKAELYGKTALLVVLRNIVSIINKTIDLYNFSTKAFNGIVMAIAKSISTAWNSIKTFFTLVGDGLKGVANSFKGFGTIIEGVFTLDTDKIKSGWSTVTGSIRGAWQSAVLDARKFGAATAKNWADGYNAVMNAEGVGHIELPGGSTGDGGSTSYSGGGSPTSSGSGGGSSSKSSTPTKSDAVKAEKQQAKAREVAMKSELEQLQMLIKSRLEIVKKGTFDELQLRLQQMENERQLAAQKLQNEAIDEETRQELLLNLEKQYQQKRDELLAQGAENERKRMEQETTNMFTARLMGAADDELEQERIKLEQLQYLRDNARQMEGESLEAWNARRLQLEQQYLDQKQSLADKEVQVEQAKLEAYSTIAGGIGKVFDAMGESNEDFAKLSKVLALAEIAINTGKAIAAGVAQAQSVPFPGNIAAIATTVATIMANIATAISTVKSAKFAKGGLIQGIGTGTSDSITAKVSNGESVMTANATALFSPLLSAINQMGGGVPIMHHSGTSSQVGEDMLAAAIAKGYAMAPAPVVSVEEITEVSNRVQAIETLANS